MPIVVVAHHLPRAQCAADECNDDDDDDATASVCRNLMGMQRVWLICRHRFEFIVGFLRFPQGYCGGITRRMRGGGVTDLRQYSSNRKFFVQKYLPFGTYVFFFFFHIVRVVFSCTSLYRYEKVPLYWVRTHSRERKLCAARHKERIMLHGSDH